MIIVAVDTSGRNGSVALCRGSASDFKVIELCPLEGGTYSARLMPAIAGLLARAQITKSQLEGLVVVDGPGSFTGLRVGLSTVKALCEVLRKPLGAVSMLEALAITYGHEGEIIAAVLDAGRGEAFVGEYELGYQGVQLLRESMCKLADIPTQRRESEARVVTPSPNVVEVLAAAGREAAPVTPLHADSIGRIGLRKLLAGDVVDPVTLDANYIRRSDAELYSPPRH